MNSTAVQLTNVSKVYHNKKAVNQVNLSIMKGSMKLLYAQ